MDFLANTEVSLPVAFARDGTPTIPDVGTVKFTVRDHAGDPLPGLVDVPVTTTPTTFQITLTIPASAGAVAAPRRFERRTVTIAATSNGLATRFIETYRLIPQLNIAVTPEQVREFLGVNEFELNDSTIDVTEAYFIVEGRIGQATFETALLAGTTAEIAANDLVRMTAVLAVIPSLKQRVAQQEKNGVKMFARPAIKNFDDLREEAERRYAAAVEVLQAGVREVVQTLVLITQDPDPITG